MRKTTFTIILVLMMKLTFAQSWLDLGLKGGYGAGILNNSNIWNDGSYNHKLSGNGFFGGKIGFNFNDEHEITADISLGKFTQEFSYNVSIADSSSTTPITQTQEYKSIITYSNLDLLLMYRHNKDGRYVEIGPRMTLISKSNRTDTYNPTPFKQSYFNDRVFGMSVGFGAYIMGTENFGITAGARLGFTFSDLISSEGKLANQPTLTSYDTYKRSFPVTLQLVFEANLDFAYMAKAKCGRRKLLLF